LGWVVWGGLGVGVGRLEGSRGGFGATGGLGCLVVKGGGCWGGWGGLSGGLSGGWVCHLRSATPAPPSRSREARKLRGRKGRRRAARLAGAAGGRRRVCVVAVQLEEQEEAARHGKQPWPGRGGFGGRGRVEGGISGYGVEGGVWAWGWMGSFGVGSGSGWRLEGGPGQAPRQRAAQQSQPKRARLYWERRANELPPTQPTLEDGRVLEVVWVGAPTVENVLEGRGGEKERGAGLFP
jgi:hypothetical protein